LQILCLKYIYGQHTKLAPYCYIRQFYNLQTSLPCVRLESTPFAKTVPLPDSPFAKLTTTLSTSLYCHIHTSIDSTNTSRLLAYSASNHSSSFDSTTRSLAHTSFSNTHSDRREDIFKGSLLWPLQASSSKKVIFTAPLAYAIYTRPSNLNPWFGPLFVRYKGGNIALDDNWFWALVSFRRAINRGFCTLEDKLSFEGGVMLQF